MDFNLLPRFKAFQFEIITRVPEWARAYEVDPPEIERQIPIAHAWCQNNRRKAPKKDIMRFLNSWMGIAKRSGSLQSTKTNSIFKEKPPEDETMSGDDWARMRKALKKGP